MALVTVCIPAYRSGGPIVHLLASLRDQTFEDFEVEVALEPVDPEPTIERCRPFLADPRFRLVLNPRQLGWGGNVRGLLWRVRTPLFSIQPHDDVVAPTYLATLVAALAARPEASVAYADAYLFGGQAGRRGSVIPDGSPARQLLEFHLDGAQGHLNRGLTRRRVLDRDYPSNPMADFSVETVWAQHLVVAGPVVHVPRPLYLRRAVLADGGSVTAGWRRYGAVDLAAAVEHNRQSLLAGIPASLPGEVARDTIVLAVEAAMLRRFTTYSEGRFGLGQGQLERAASLLATTTPTMAGQDPDIARIRAQVHTVVSRHHAATGDRDAALREVRAALDLVPDDWDACLWLARLLDPDAAFEMVELLERAIAVGPVDPVVRSVMGRLDDVLARRYADPGA